MTLLDTLQAQLTDPFRIGLIVIMVLTAMRTQGALGMVIPLALGVVFVALLIPLTMQSGQSSQGAALVWAAGVGVGANLILLGGVLAIRAAVLRARR